ncbi:PqiB family protein [Thiorhodovibrio frisius]|uniref:Qaraquat-inducible protein B n=1 Tax=Thiorhodovibrio frisius TaxID=631362 RepID=H8YXD3_9GAMM|nr:MlaD family protein [Thiorhodovibrio frisius]EIC23109.1 qaraquat-inducible protein B [Thiorhodovibrio frisius]WPL22627.1 Paraquat-inducible protein B [Thiorhodovibrio frisius]
MTQPKSQDAQTQSSDAGPALAEARVVKRERLSLVWLVPLVAVVIGAWLAYHAISQRGPTITIEFDSASGLLAGKTKVKFKDVVIGQVTAIALSENLEKVLVTAELTPDSGHYLTHKTRFWVARPRVTPSQITGLETLLSGAYVAIDPVIDGESARHFVGLKDPPVITTSQPGLQFSLRASSLGSLNLGSPVYYRHIQVGQVVNYRLDDDGGGVTIEIFIAEPYHDLVYSNTRFWNASGFDVRMTADGVVVDSESVISMLIGGVGFDTLDTLDDKGTQASDGQYFPLYANRKQAYERAYLNKKRYVLLFDGSVRGLSVNAPVLVRGIQVGQVLDIQLEFDPSRIDFQIPVLIEIEPERVNELDPQGDATLEQTQQPLTTTSDQSLLRAMVANGLRAQLKTGSLLTGQLYVEFDLHPDAPPVEIGQRQGYPVLPTLPTDAEAMATKANRILTEVEAIPFRRIGEDLSAILAGVRTLVDSTQLRDALTQVDQLLDHLVRLSAMADRQLSPELLGLITEAQGSFKNFNAQFAPGAPMSAEALRSLQEFQSVARSVGDLADYLERHPEALLRGKGGVR